MKNDFAKAIKRESTEHCNPNALAICRDIMHGASVVQIKRSHHVRTAEATLCARGLGLKMSVCAIQLALYRAVSRRSSGVLIYESVKKILRQAERDFNAMA